jgi:hypothetical protein
MALFGAPIAHENHAVRAVAAALAIERRLEDYAETLHRERAIDFAVRIGINTGPVVVGKIGDDLRMDYTAQGETVNLAARLQEAACPGSVLISEFTHRAIRGFFHTRDEGERQMKGFDGPVHAYRVVGQRSRRARFDLAVERGLTPLVGRGPHLRFLRDCWDRAAAGQGQVVSIVGEAGAGKSRIAYEFRRTLDPASFTYAEGRGLPHAALPFHLIVQLLEDLLGLSEGERESARAEKVERGVRALDPALEWTVPLLERLLGLRADRVPADDLDHAQGKRRLIETVRVLVLRLAERRPLLLLAEDVQWIDPNSAEVLHALIDGLALRPILLIATYRQGHAPAWQDHSYHRRLAVDLLSRPEASQMLAALAGALGEDLRELALARGG